MKKILVILPRFPYPLEKGDKLRAYHLVKNLSQRHEVYLFAVTHDNVKPAAVAEMQQYCKEISIARISKLGGLLRALRNLFTVRSLQIGYWQSRRAVEQCRQFSSRIKPDVLIAQMVRTMGYAAAVDCRRILDFQDALSMNFERRMKDCRGLRYFLLHYEFKMLRSAEYDACSLFDRLTIISQTDADAIPAPRDTQIHIVPNGVDFDYFKPDVATAKTHSVVFCGNMQYTPNIDAARCLALTIMPLVWRSHPDARLLIAGATPTAAVRSLASPLVEVSGTVADIRPCYASSQVFAAPMRIGSGLQNKLLEAMSMELPCVTTTLANRSLGATDGSHLLVADSEEAFAAAIVRLLDNAELRQSLTTAANAFVRENYSWQSAAAAIDRLID